MKTVLNSSEITPFTHKTKTGARAFLVPNMFVAKVSNKVRKECNLGPGLLHKTDNRNNTHAQVFVEGVGVTMMNVKNLKSDKAA